MKTTSPAVPCTPKKECLPALIRDNLLAGSRRLPAEDWTGGQICRQIPYADASPAQWLTLYLPRTPAPAPLLVLIHGGGFVTNDAESHQVQQFYRYFRDRGWACATVNYRLAGEASFPAALEDVKAALRFLGQQGRTYGYDPRGAALWGESAGAYLAVMAAFTAADAYAGQPCVGETGADRFPTLPLAALVDYYGPSDITTQEAQYTAMGVPAWVRRVANSWLLKYAGPFATAEERWMGKPLDRWTPAERDAFVPCRQVAAHACPYPGLRTLLVHGDADLTVAPAQSEQLCRVLQQTYGPEAARLERVPHCKHADDRLFTPERLARVEDFLRACRAEQSR